ncbi:hypothetical protein L2E82_42194 [Cichorium intybus]|uniref:Uncharacterized protein n=1 Tax=Cichorium intybus TaxID=13427 RepID=A0ACB8ZLF6_CICIN|nr:hypothetical protein L2E82_42194 [Cichorium intybus]
MGCVFGKEISSPGPPSSEIVIEKRRERDRDTNGHSGWKEGASTNIDGEHVPAGWSTWLSTVAGEAINGWIPKRANTFEKIDKMVGNMHLAMKSNFVCELLQRSVLRRELGIPTYDVAAIFEFVIDFGGSSRLTVVVMGYCICLYT